MLKPPHTQLTNNTDLMAKQRNNKSRPSGDLVLASSYLKLLRETSALFHVDSTELHPLNKQPPDWRRQQKQTS